MVLSSERAIFFHFVIKRLLCYIKEVNISMAEPFYNRGLNFSCHRCSRCCRHDPGFVFLSEQDLDLLIKGLGLSREELLRTYCREVDINGRRRVSLTEKPGFDCIFWENGGCAAYEYRPFQCRSYPFWSSNLSSALQWEALKSTCPGVGEGRVHSKEEIETWIERRNREPLINRL
jgi:hypothetical protein